MAPPSPTHPERRRDRVPVPHSDVRSAFVPARELVEEDTELGFSGQTAAFDGGIGGQAVAVREYGPLARDMQRDGAVHRADL